MQRNPTERKLQGEREKEGKTERRKEGTQPNSQHSYTNSFTTMAA